MNIFTPLVLITVVMASKSKVNTLTTRHMNNTRKSEIDILFFNRAAKVGSEALLQLIESLEKYNDFQLKRDGLINPSVGILKRSEQNELAEKIIGYGEGVVYIDHVFWIDFGKFGLPLPIYINLVRDPVERVISWYFYVRGAYKNAILYRKRPNEPLKPEEWYKKDFNECVRNGDPECQYVPYSVKDTEGNFKRQSQFYCGHHQDCLPFNSPYAVQMAKNHVERYFAVVGSWEDTNITLTVLEKYIPRYFQGAKFFFEMNNESIQNRNRNNRKPKVDADVREIIRKNVTNEYEFYYFCKQRLYKQYLALGLEDIHKFN